MILNEHSGVAHVQQNFTDRNGLAHVEQKFTDLALAQRSSPHVTEFHQPTWISTCGTVLTAPGYTYPKTPKSNDIGIEPHQIQQAIENNPSMGKPYKKSACTCLGQMLK
jgi:hypothetical protein